VVAVLAVALPIDQAAVLVDALLLAAEVERIRDPRLAAEYTEIADEIGDALDACPVAPAYDGGPAVPAALRSSLPSARPILRAVPG